VSQAARSAQITLRALVTARWVLLGLLLAAGVLVELDPEGLDVAGWLPDHPRVGPFAAILVSWAALNVGTEVFVLRRGRATSRIAGIHLLLDATMLTILLARSGGPTNAFTTLYFVPITLATQISSRWTWTLAAYCLAGFAALFLLVPVSAGPPGHETHFVGHLRGMWVAFGASGALITYFVHRIAVSLERQRAELARLREDALEARHLGALGSLAAGAAHELGTPLGSIELLAAELEHMDDDERTASIATVREQVARCKTILQRMASPELRVVALGELGGEPWSFARLRDDLLPVPGAAEVTVDDATHGADSRTPRPVLAQVLRELVANAAESGATRIEVRLGVEGDRGCIRVRDDGRGMAPEIAEHAFDPFYSTKSQGLGLGLYLARAQIRQLGGTLELETGADEGTTVSISLPLRPPPPRTLP
jgi:two-component system sensor histidine kinase RegB